MGWPFHSRDRRLVGFTNLAREEVRRATQVACQTFRFTPFSPIRGWKLEPVGRSVRLAKLPDAAKQQTMKF